MAQTKIPNELLEIGAKAFGTSSIMIGDTTTGTIDAANYNTGLGVDVFAGLTTGDYNTAIGYRALEDNTTGSRNTGVGRLSIGNNTTGDFNTAIGYGSLAANSTADSNTGLGYAALGTNTTGANNTAAGVNAMVTNTTGNQNVAVGEQALYGNTTASYNTAVGYDALRANTTGANNTAVGNDAGDAITTGSANTCVGSSASVSAVDASGQIVIGYNVTSAGNNYFSFGQNAEGVVSNQYSANASWARGSDERLKTNITNDTLGLDFIKDLRTVTFKWKPNNEHPKTFNSYQEQNVKDTSTVMHGMIAQEVKTALDTAGVSTFGGWVEGQDGTQLISQEMFIYPLIKAVQELSAKLTAAEARISALES